MGKRGGGKKVSENQSIHPKRMTLREEARGKMQSKGGGANLKAVLKHEHLKKLAVWASAGANIPSLAAFFGNRLAAVEEAAGIAPDPQLFSCQRCETILQPGFNCTIRIEKTPSRKTWQKRKKPNFPPTKNSVVYRCHFCSQRNSMRGTPRSHMKETFPSKAKPVKQLPEKCINKPINTVTEDPEIHNPANVHSPSRVPAMDDKPNPEAATPGPPTRLLLDRDGRKRNRSGSGKANEPDCRSNADDDDKTGGGTSKRKRKTWTSLKVIAENDSSSNMTSLKIPFLL